MTDLARVDQPKPVPQSRRTLPKYALDKDRPYEGDPWLRQPNETAMAYSAFCLYRDLEPSQRTITAAYKLHCEREGKPLQRRKKDGTVNTSSWSKWSTCNRWTERVEAFDSFTDAKLITANRRSKIRAATKHAEQAAALQEIAMLPVNELRERLRAQGGQLSVIADLDEVSLIKLVNAVGRDLPSYQKAEREALGSTSETVVATREIRAKGEIVKRMLADRTMGDLMERVSIEESVTVRVENDEG